MQLALVVWLALVVTARADDVIEAMPTITLADLLRAAQRDPPRVREALATLRRIASEQHLAEGAYYPRLTGEGTLGAQYDNRRVLPGESESGRIDSTSWAASASVTVDWPALDRARKHDVAAAKATTRAGEHGADERARSVTLEAVELYLRGLFAGELVRDAALTLDRRKQQQETIEALAKAGVRPKVDAVRARVDLLAASYALEVRQTDERAGFAALAASVGRAPEEGLRPLPLEADTFRGPSDVAAASALALTHRPEIAMQKEQLRALDESERAARAARLPTVGVIARGQALYFDVVRGAGIEGDQYAATGGAYLRYEGGDATVKRRRLVAQRRIDEARRALDATSLAIRAEAVDAAYAVARTRAQVEQATQVLEAAQVARTAQHERYAAGIASLLELLDAESIEQTARRARIEASRDHDLARARLLAVCGTLSARLR